MKKNAFITTLVGTLASVGLTLVYAIILGLIQNGVFALKFGEEAFVAFLPYQTAYILAAFAIFEVLFFIWLFTSMASEKDKNNAILDEKASKKMHFAVKIAACVGLFALILMVVLSVNIYTEVSENGVKKNSFVVTDEYKWDDAYNAVLECKSSGELTYTIQFKDGKTLVLISYPSASAGANTVSDTFSEKYGDMMSFSVAISDKLDSLGKTTSVRGLQYLEQIYKTNEKTWEQLVRIGNIT